MMWPLRGLTLEQCVECRGYATVPCCCRGVIWTLERAEPRWYCRDCYQAEEHTLECERRARLEP